MSETSEKPEIKIAGKYSSAESLKKQAREEVTPRIGGLGNLTEALRESAGAMQKSAAAQERMARGEYVIDFERLGLKGEAEQQREFIRPLLDGIEKSNRDTHDVANNYLVRGLETSLDQMEPDVTREVRARLAVHDCSQLIKEADGWIFREIEKVGPGYSIGSAAAEAERRGHSLNREIIETFLGYGEAVGGVKEPFMPGLDVPLAWDLLQELNFNYRNLVERELAELKGIGAASRTPDQSRKIEYLQKGIADIRSDEEKKNFFKDPNADRKEILRASMVERLRRETRIRGGLSEEEAEKSFQLAEKLARASLEESVFDKGDTSVNDQLGEIVGLKEWRARRKKTGRERGPLVHEEEIDGFGSSWLRNSISGSEADVDRPLKAEEVTRELDKIKSDWTYFCTVIVTRYKLLDGLILDRKPKVTEMDKTFLQGAVVYFNTADKPDEGRKLGPKKLRGLWATGVVDMVLADRTLQFPGKSIGEVLADFVRALTREQLSPEAGTFITEKTWAYIKGRLNFDARLRARGGEAALGEYIRKTVPM